MDGLDELLDAHPDVHHDEVTFEFDAETFASAVERAEDGVRHAVAAVVENDGGEIALVKNEWSEGWVLPGGSIESDETRREAAVREVREETGLEVGVEDPVAVVEQTFACGEESLLNVFVVFRARAETTELTDGPDIDDPEIEAVAWFDSVPDECENAELLDAVLD